MVSAQEGSGTQSTWKTFLGFDPVTETTVNCTSPSNCAGPLVIFENELSQLNTGSFTGSQQSYVNSTSLWGSGGLTNAQLEEDSIFFYSYGKYKENCKTPTPTTHAVDCGQLQIPVGDSVALPKIGGSNTATSYVVGAAPTEANILEGTYTVPRYLYNVYSNGSNSNIPASSPATLNYVSEDGFLCKPVSEKGTDPNSTTSPPASYEGEIQATIKANGFFGLSAGASSGTVNQTPFDEYLAGGVPPHTAASLLSGTPYASYDAVVPEGNGDPTGFCQVYNTDGNSTP